MNMNLPEPTHEAIFDITYSNDGLTMYFILAKMKGLVSLLEANFESIAESDNRIDGWYSNWEVDSNITEFQVSVIKGMTDEERLIALNDCYAVVLNFVNAYLN